MNSIMAVSTNTPTTNAKRKPIKYRRICHDSVRDLLSLYVHVASKHQDGTQTALAALME